MKCSGCGREFSCEISEGKDKCWCFDYPPVVKVPGKDEDCYCPDCLSKKTGTAPSNPKLSGRDSGK